MNPELHRVIYRRPARFLLTTVLIALLGGCAWGVPGSQPEPDLIEPLPADWMILDTDSPWTAVNIDGDPETEFLLLYTYNNSADGSRRGPTGASIYDLQNNTELSNLPDQTSPTYRAYRIQPNYWKGSDSFFIAEPGKEANVTTTTVPRVADEHRHELPDNVTSFVEADQTKAQTYLTELNQELLIEGGNSTLTFVWWRNLRDGYGVATVHAAEGFRNYTYPLGNDGLPPDEFDGLHPLHDRSQLCTVLHYTRELMDATKYNVYYQPALRGLQFCDSVTPPTTPFYPEAVVLAYLVTLGGIDKTQASVNTDHWTDFGDAQARFDRLFVAEPDAADRTLDRTPWLVYGLFGPVTLPYNGSKHVYYASVCAELLDTRDNTIHAYRFRLRHNHPEYEQRRTDEWRITDVEPITRPRDGTPPDCSQIVKPATPGRVREP